MWLLSFLVGLRTYQHHFVYEIPKDTIYMRFVKFHKQEDYMTAVNVRTNAVETF